jgi:PKD repeat protein
MKKFGFIILGLILILTSCEERRPRADFEPSKYTVEPYEEIVFFNYSSYADYFDWDFGDNYYSSEEEPAHYYTRPGIYTVKLTAINGDFIDESYVEIEVVPYSTVLDIQVLEYYQKYPVSGASIIVYPTYNDWYNQTNDLVEVFTNSNGIAVIEGLAPGTYYLDIWEKNHNNEDLAFEDINNIKTPYLQRGKTTQITAYVDYISSASALKSRPVKRQANAVPVIKRTCIPTERK